MMSHGFDQVVVGAFAQRLDRRFEGCVASQYDCYRVGRYTAQLAQDVQAVDITNTQIGQNQVEEGCGGELQGLHPGCGCHDLMALELEHALDRGQDRLLIVDDEDTTCRFRRRGHR